ncbi:YfiR family protein [Chitinimonas lacunae]|uniref:YfiR family protein n=1 Tax=Chitinimonas lacunae TaxID=1963018 RepID=A0ABV8MJI7_9NEIS
MQPRFHSLLAPTIRWLLLALLACNAAAITDPNLEARVKAAFLYKFATYVEWPDAGQSEAPFVVGIVESDQIAAALQLLAPGRHIGRRPLVVRRLKTGDSPNGVQMLFVGQSTGAALKTWIDNVRGQPVLVVTETEGALTQGSVINFVLAEQHVRFEISLPAAEQRHLKISSRLLSVARQVQTGSAP